MITAKEIMTKDVITAKEDSSVIEVLDTLLENKISGLPVTDDNNNLIAIITEKDLLNTLFLEDLDVTNTIEPYLSKKVISFKVDDSIYEICDFFLKHNIRRVPIEQDGKLMGVISRRDIMRIVLKAVVSKNP
ncbi:MAG: CBS domain-containing protein [Candidatus Omnitrophica bacterium]|nr:CBS domain-containing protein [Candidatus Omnitrophota bacterium]